MTTVPSEFEDQDPVAEDDSEGQGDDDELEIPEKAEGGYEVEDE